MDDEAVQFLDLHVRAQTRCNIFLGYTSNLISSGLREVILHLVKYNHVAAIVTTAGGIEEDFIKCLGKTYIADFNLDGTYLRERGMNRIGNLVVPNDNYCKFEDWLTPILDAMLAEQKKSGKVWSPSSFIRRLGREINNEESVYYWAYKVQCFHLLLQ
jgi:deoxyhypusine synthase